MIILETIPEPKVGGVRIKLDQWVDVRISAEDAREKVHGWLFAHITMMEAEQPIFVVGDLSVWRIPVAFYANNVGRVGRVGTIDVDVNTGDILSTVEEAQKKLYPPAKKMAEKYAEIVPD